MSHKKTRTIYIDALDETPLGAVWVAVSNRGLVGISLYQTKEGFTADMSRFGTVTDDIAGQTAVAQQQLHQYFQKERTQFDHPIDWSIFTTFQAKALRAVADIPYGELRTYKQIAQTVGNLKAIRAVGRANATNPIPIVLPCHRVLGSDGKLHGYASGLETKAWLLRLEGSWLL